VPLLEGEPCADPYTDNYDAGCNATPPAFYNVNAVCEGTIVICVRSSTTYSPSGSARRDTDWFQLVDLPLMGATDIYATSYYESSGSLVLHPDCGSLHGYDPAGIHIGPRDWVC